MDVQKISRFHSLTYPYLHNGSVHEEYESWEMCVV